MEPVLTRNFDLTRGPLDRAGYEAAGGYRGLRRALAEIAPAELIEMVGRAGLRGRGGAGFPTARKWAELPPPAESARPRCLLVNFDEMEPGTFKDRYLATGDPHQLIEGVLLGAWACQVDLGYVFIRAEYVEPARLVSRALAEARAAGYVGRNILGSGWDFELFVHTSAGRYMCGEGMGLIGALEGKRANPRTRPPHAATCGVWGKPTVVNNVETFCCVPHIVERGPDWFRALGKAIDAGPKIYGLSGHVARPGAWERPMGTSLAELLEAAGGMKPGRRFRGALVGGASSSFLDERDLDLALDFQTLKDRGDFFGTGTAVVLDDRTCPVGMALNLARFFARESCGWCTPCWSGLAWIARLLGELEAGRGRPGDLDLIAEQIGFIGPHSFCALAQGAQISLESMLARLRPDFELHVERASCPWKRAG